MFQAAPSKFPVIVKIGNANNGTGKARLINRIKNEWREREGKRGKRGPERD